MYLATARLVANLPSSAGCRATPPTSNQALAPFTSRPKEYSDQ